MRSAPFVLSTGELTEAMPELDKVTKGDVVYDLGGGDGRLVIMAAKRYGARASSPTPSTWVAGGRT